MVTAVCSSVPTVSPANTTSFTSVTLQQGRVIKKTTCVLRSVFRQKCKKWTQRSSILCHQRFYVQTKEPIICFQDYKKRGSYLPVAAPPLLFPVCRDWKQKWTQMSQFWDKQHYLCHTDDTILYVTGSSFYPASANLQSADFRFQISYIKHKHVLNSGKIKKCCSLQHPRIFRLNVKNAGDAYKDPRVTTIKQTEDQDQLL